VTEDFGRATATVMLDGRRALDLIDEGDRTTVEEAARAFGDGSHL